MVQKQCRTYYRCTHGYSQGCAAKKQVQRSNKDPTLFHVIYHGIHTCTQNTAAMETWGAEPEAVTGIYE